MTNFPSFIQALEKSGGGQYAWLYGHVSKRTGEITNRQIQVGFSYMDLLGRAIVAAKRIDPATILAECEHCTSLEQANAILDRVRAAYDNRMANPKGSPYVPVDNKGKLKQHPETGVMYITGLHVKRIVVKPGEHKPVASGDETLIRQWIEKQCDRITHYRTFKLFPDTWDRFLFNGKIYTPQGFMSGQV